MNNYWLGDQVTIFETFTVEGVPTDPDTVTFTIVLPDGSEVVYTDAQPEVDHTVEVTPNGLYELAYLPPVVGRYTYRVVGTGAALAAIEGEFNVFSRVPATGDPLYVTPLELAAVLRLNIEPTDTSANPVLDDLDRDCNAACRAIDEMCDTCFALRDDSNDEVRYFTPLGPNLCLIDDVASVTSVSVDRNEDGTYEQLWTENSEYVLLKTHAASVAPSQRPFNRIRVRGRSAKQFPPGDQVVEVVGRFGWETTPWQIIEAAGLLAQQLFKRRQEAPFGIVTFGVDQPAALRLLRKDPHLCELLEPFMPTEVG